MDKRVSSWTRGCHHGQEGVIVDKRASSWTRGCHRGQEGVIVHKRVSSRTRDGKLLATQTPFMIHKCQYH